MSLRSIQTRFLLIVVLVTTGVFAAFGYWNYRVGESERTQALEAQMDTLAHQLANSLALDLWDMNLPGIRQIAAAQMSQPVLLGIAVEAFGRQVYGVRRDGQPFESLEQAPTADEVRVVVVRHGSGSAAQDIGTVRLYLSFEQVHAALRRGVWVTLLQFTILNLTVVAAMAWAMRRVVVKPMQELGEALAHIASGEADLSRRLSHSQTAEFAAVTDSFNAFSDKLQLALGGSIDRVQQAIAKVARGDLHADLLPGAQVAEDSILGRLALMQDNLRHAAEALMQAKSAAEEGARVKGEFLANMSHEIRTPMNAIIGLSNLALKADMPPTVQAYLQKIRQSGEHLLGIINDILDFSKIESGKMQIESLPFALATLLENVLTVMGDRADAKGLLLTQHIDPRIPAVLMGDPLRLRQVLINFANNAVKFTAQGQVELRVELHGAQNAQPVLRFAISDTGIGLSAEQIGRLFLGFAQADASITRNFGGTGLGLAISKQLVEAMGGEVGVHSVLGHGSTFWFTVPLQVARPEASGSADATRLESGLEDVTQKRLALLEQGMHSVRGARVLLVEDNEINQLVAVEMLQGVGLEVDVAGNGRIALECVASAAAQGRPYALVLMDMQMPVMDGISATRHLREVHSAQQLPIVAMTANAMVADRERCLAVGMNGFVTKPVRAEELWQTLLQWLPAPHAAGLEDAAAPVHQAPQDPVLAPGAADTGQATRVKLCLQYLHDQAALDVHQGLQRSNQNAPLYLRLLRLFLQSQSGAVARIREALRQGDTAAAEREAHTLKGVSANLGAMPLQQAAAALEAALHEGMPRQNVTLELEQTIHALDQLLGELVAVLQATPGLEEPQAAGSGSEVLSTEQMAQSRHLLEQLARLLANDDATAITLWEAHAARLRAAHPEGVRLEAALHAYAFDAALDLLRATNHSAPMPP